MDKKIFKNKSFIGILVIFFVISLFIGESGAKYVYETLGSGLFSAKEFYFESNLLRNEGAEYTLNPTTNSISFTLSNAIDELRYSEDEITYEIKVIESGNDVTSTILGSYDGILENNTVSTDTITLINLVRGKTYSVAVKGSAGYVKTLSANFTVSDSDKNIYKNLAVYDDYVVLTVWTENLKGDITIDFPAGLVPDGTDPVLSDVYNYENSEYIAKTFVDGKNFENVYSSHQYRFFIDEESDANIMAKNYYVRQVISENEAIIGEVGSLK